MEERYKGPSLGPDSALNGTLEFAKELLDTKYAAVGLLENFTPTMHLYDRTLGMPGRGWSWWARVLGRRNVNSMFKEQEEKALEEASDVKSRKIDMKESTVQLLGGLPAFFVRVYIYLTAGLGTVDMVVCVFAAPNVHLDVVYEPGRLAELSTANWLGFATSDVKHHFTVHTFSHTDALPPPRSRTRG